MDPDKIKAAIEALKNQDAEAALTILEEMIVSAAGGSADPAPAATSDAADPAATPADENAEPAPKKDELAQLCKLTGKATFVAALAEVQSIVEKLSALRSEQAQADNAARVELIAELVQVGGETPATAWEGDPEKRKPCARLSTESLDSLRTRVTALGGKPAKQGTKPPVDSAVAKLSARELAECERKGIKPEVFAARKASAVRRSK
jgi:hypothetical protein